MPARELTTATMADYIAQAIGRADAVYAGRPPDDPAYALALGETVALFNLADEFGLITEVRRLVDERAGRDVYRGLSEAMKGYYLGSATGGQAKGGPATGPRDRRPPGGPSRSGRPPAQGQRGQGARPSGGRAPRPAPDQRRRSPPT